MHYHPDSLREIIRMALELIDTWSPSAEELVLGTAAKESHLGRWLAQVGGGPARGAFQMELATERDIWRNYLFYEDKLREAVTRATGLEGPDPDRLQFDPVYGAIMCRCHYLRIRAPLPLVHDVPGQAAYWDEHYNRNDQHGFAWEYIELYQALILGAG